VSGNDSPQDVSEGYALGAADYIKKPFVTNDVKKRVDKIFMQC